MGGAAGACLGLRARLADRPDHLRRQDIHRLVRDFLLGHGIVRQPMRMVRKVGDFLPDRKMMRHIAVQDTAIIDRIRDIR